MKWNDEETANWGSRQPNSALWKEEIDAGGVGVGLVVYPQEEIETEYQAHPL